MDELAVDEQRDVRHHGMYTVLDDGASFGGLAAVDVVDVNGVHS